MPNEEMFAEQSAGYAASDGYKLVFFAKNECGELARMWPLTLVRDQS